MLAAPKFRGAASFLAELGNLMKRAYYSSSIAQFINTSPNEILGALASASGFTIDPTQRDAWLTEINILKTVLANREGRLDLIQAILDHIRCLLSVGELDQQLQWDRPSPHAKCLPGDCGPG